MAFVLIDGHDLPARDALTEHLISLVEQYAGPQGGPVAQIIAECQYDEGTLHEFRERFWDGRRAATRALVARAIREGDLRDDLEPELMVELVYSAVYVRLLVRLPRARPRVRRADHRDGDGGNRRADRGVTVPDRVARLIAEAHWYRTGAASGVRTAARSTQDRV
jgi:hypothetical protein